MCSTLASRLYLQETSKMNQAKQHRSKTLLSIYHRLFALYGEQGWWPVCHDLNSDDNRENYQNSYHIGRYDYPRDDKDRLEICIGAILTQNTNWLNVVKALEVLKQEKMFSIPALQKVDEESLAVMIRSAGYFRQKTGYLKNLVRFLKEHSFQELESMEKQTARKKLLAIKGIGPETADCMLLYALNHCSFVVDAYTKRFMESLQLMPKKEDYHSIQALFETSIPRDLKIYQEYHALIVEHGKRFYSKKPYGVDDPILHPENET